MNTKTLLIAGALGCTLLSGRSLSAADRLDPPVIVPREVADRPEPPVIVSRDAADRELLRDLRGAPPEVRRLILSFDNRADRYLAQQRELMQRLRAATGEEQERIRQRLQTNREAFLRELRDFRQNLRQELNDLRGQVTHREFNRIIEAARDAGGDRNRRGRN